MEIGKEVTPNQDGKKVKCANVLNKNKSRMSNKPTVEPKNIVVQHHIGERNNIIISRNFHGVRFKLLSTVSATSAVVPPGAKVWYEVSYLPGGVGAGAQQIGWATNNLQTSDERSYIMVGSENDSYGFDPFRGEKWHGGNIAWGEKLQRSNGGYVGVALDTVKGEVLYSTNGDWNAPNGVAFNGIDINTQFFPALSGSYVRLEVNFGDRDFRYGPPTSDFVKLIDVL